MTQARKSVAVIIPAYNEGTVVRGVVRDMIKAMKDADIKGDIIVVDDGSKDNTASEARGGGATVISHIINSGAGEATATGLMFARLNKYDVAATMDADGQHTSKDVINGIKEIGRQRTDLLIGSRLINPKQMSTIKKVGNRGLSFITYVLFGVNVADSQSGLRVFSRSAIKDLRWKTSGFEFCSEMIWRAKQLGLKIDEYPIDVVYTDYSRSKGQSNWNGVNILKSLIVRRFVELFE